MDRLLRSIASFHAGHGRLLQPHLESLAQDGQRPQVMVITCSDSRILLDPLNVGNLVPNDDDPSVAAADYAVENLHVPDIVVMGHAECGAPSSLLSPLPEGAIGRWLQYGQEALEALHAQPCDPARPEHDCLSQRNVLVQAERVRQMASVQTSGAKVHAWWWDMADAHVLAWNGEAFVPVERRTRRNRRRSLRERLANGFFGHSA